MLNYKKYKRVPVLHYPEREWPDKEIEKAPIWCSVDLRDGNQALIDPMNVEEKMEMFNLLLKLGFKEIEIGFPAASQVEYDFLRELVEKDMIPDDVTVQVLTQCREHLINRTFEAIQGIKNVIVHIYNSTSTLQREVVFHMNREEIKQIAIDGTKMVKERAKNFDGKIQLEYSPESFTGTEMDFALDICTAVQDVWQPTEDNKIIINLPATVEMNTPNVYADQIEWMNKHFKDREKIILSVHPHNDRGTGVAATELALLAGADRVEGTLFGNGERTGNVDILNVAYNMFSQGINPKLNIEDVNEIIDVYERCSKMSIDMRHPYAGMHKEFADVIQKLSEEIGGEVSPEQIMEKFESEYLTNKTPYEFVRIKVEDIGEKDSYIRLDYKYNGKDMHVEGEGNGPIDAVKRAINSHMDLDVCIKDYSEHAMGSGSHAKAAAYIRMRDNRTGKETYGVGVSSNITRASIRSFFSALNRIVK